MGSKAPGKMPAIKMPAIGEYMTPAPLTVRASEPVKRAKLLMSTRGIRHLPVLEDSDVVGVVSDRDIKLAQAVSHAPGFDDTPVREICQSNPYIVDATEPSDKVLEHLCAQKIGSALVMFQGQLVGIFTVTDACRAFASFLRKVCGEPGRSKT